MMKNRSCDRQDAGGRFSDLCAHGACASAIFGESHHTIVRLMFVRAWGADVNFTAYVDILVFAPVAEELYTEM